MDWRGIMCRLLWPLIWVLNLLDKTINWARNNWKVLSVMAVSLVVAYPVHLTSEQRALEQENAENRRLQQEIWTIQVQIALRAIQRQHRSSEPLYERYIAQYARCTACTMEVAYTGLESCQVVLFFPVNGGGLGQTYQDYTGLAQLDLDRLEGQIYEGTQQNANLDLITLPAEDEWQDHFQPVIKLGQPLIDPD